MGDVAQLQEFNEYILENGEPDEDGNLHIPLKDVSEKVSCYSISLSIIMNWLKYLKNLDLSLTLKETIMSLDRNSIMQHIIERCIEGDVEKSSSTY